MGHLLSTVNPEAAAAIQPDVDPFAVRAPEVGEIVHYFARLGEGRSGRMIFPAFVMRVEHEGPRRGLLELIVIYGVDDVRGYSNVRRKTHDETMNVWDFMPGALGNQGDINMILKSLFGEHTMVEESVYGMLKESGKTLKRQAEELKALAERIGTLEADQMKGGSVADD